MQNSDIPGSVFAGEKGSVLVLIYAVKGSAFPRCALPLESNES